MVDRAKKHLNAPDPQGHYCGWLEHQPNMIMDSPESVIRCVPTVHEPDVGKCTYVCGHVV